MRSRGTDVRAGFERDLIEAGLNEPAVAVSGYGDCVAAPIPDGDRGARGDGWKGDGPKRSGLPGAGPRYNGGPDGSWKDGLSGVWRAVCTVWRVTPGGGIAAAPMRSEPARCPMLMIRHTRRTALAATLDAAGCR